MCRPWKNYINFQLRSECQLISALNAYYYLTGNRITQDSQEYESLIDLSLARKGTALNIEKVHDKLGIEPIGYSNHFHILINKWYKFNTQEEIEFPKEEQEFKLPIEMNVFHKKTGFHSVLIVDTCIKTECIRITNFSDATSLNGWFFSEDLYQYIHHCNQGWVFRLFGIKKKGSPK